MIYSFGWTTKSSFGYIPDGRRFDEVWLFSPNNFVWCYTDFSGSLVGTAANRVISPHSPWTCIPLIPVSIESIPSNQRYLIVCIINRNVATTKSLQKCYLENGDVRSRSALPHKWQFMSLTVLTRKLHDNTCSSQSYCIYYVTSQSKWRESQNA